VGSAAILESRPKHPGGTSCFASAPTQIFRSSGCVQAQARVSRARFGRGDRDSSFAHLRTAGVHAPAGRPAVHPAGSSPVQAGYSRCSGFIALRAIRASVRSKRSSTGDASAYAGSSTVARACDW